MAKFDKIYIDLCKKILNEGVWTENRTGTDTIMIPNYYFQIDVGDEFPILTTKQVFIRQAVLEMLWIWQEASNDVRWLKDRDVNIWNEWMIDDDGIYRIYDKYEEYDENKEVIVKDLDGNDTNIKAKSRIPGKNIKEAKYYGKEYAYTIGTAYGYIVDKYKLMESLLDTLENNPTDRRMVKSLWQDCYLKTAVLPSCVWSTMWGVCDGKLNLTVIQRSCDVPLGLPFNVSQYATLLCMVAKTRNLEVGNLYWNINNAHIYEDQIEGIKEQIERFDTKEDLPAPQLWLNPDVNNFYDYDNSKECKDVKVLKYKHHGKITFPISQ